MAPEEGRRERSGRGMKGGGRESRGGVDEVERSWREMKGGRKEGGEGEEMGRERE